ncbi:hypothetical protein BOX15_Mlig029424g2, partial [Macrostomum lignano]
QPISCFALKLEKLKLDFNSQNMQPDSRQESGTHQNRRGAGGISRHSRKQLGSSDARSPRAPASPRLSKQRLRLIVSEIVALREYKQQLTERLALAKDLNQTVACDRLACSLDSVRALLQLFFRYYCQRSGRGGAAMSDLAEITDARR